jgi:enamine deaminase RidA (YjgF/YER057c/UK114 family)
MPKRLVVAGILVSLSVSLAAPAAAQSIEYIDPAGGFTQVVTATAGGVTTVHVSGQVGEGGGLAMQSASLWQRIAQRLEEAGGSFSDLVKTTTYIVDLDPATFFALYQDGVPPAVWNLDDHAASTVIGVPSLANDRFVVEVDAVAVMGVGGQSVAREFIDPTRSFSQAVTTRGSGPKTVYVSGQVGRPGDAFAEQADQAYANLKQRLEAAGATVADLLKVTVYIPGYGEDNLRALGAVRQKHGFTDGSAPASTLLGIQSLYASEAAIEVEGVAVVR